MQSSASVEKITCRLLAALWDPQALPDLAAVPWVEALDLLAPSNIRAVLYPLARPAGACLPPGARAALAEAYYHAIADALRGLEQLARVGQALAATGAPLLLLKGAALAQALYPEPALRRMGDIDLAVPREFVPACRQALLELGYRPLRAEHLPGSRLEHKNQEVFQPPVPEQVLVELHWHILDVPYYMSRIPMDWFWQRSAPLSIAGQTFQALEPTANLVYLPAHLALHHGLQSWHSLVDLALLVVQNRETLDWGPVIAAAQSFDLLIPLGRTLDSLAERWPDLPLAGPRRALAGRAPSATEARLYRLLTAETRTTTLDFYTNLVSLPGFPARARYAWAQLFPQPAYMRERYPVGGAWQLPGWYLYRLASGLLRLAARLPQARRIDRGA